MKKVLFGLVLAAVALPLLGPAEARLSGRKQTY